MSIQPNYLQLTTDQRKEITKARRFRLDKPDNYVREDGTAMLGREVLGRFFTVRLLGSGTDAKVYEVYDKSDNTLKAMKIGKRQVENETEVYSELDGETVVGFPKMHHYDFDRYERFGLVLLVQDRLGHSVDKMRRLHVDGTLNIKSIMMLGIQMITRLEEVHKMGFVHQDLKPQNLLAGREDPRTVYLTDFGLARRFRDAETGEHVEMGTTAGTVGTALYISTNAGKHLTQSRRDDLEALAYVLIELYCGRLPWDVRPGEGMGFEEFAQEVHKKKVNVTIRKMVRSMPVELGTYLRTVRKLKFDEEPDYDLLRGLLELAMKNCGMGENDGKFEWVPEPSSYIEE